MNTKYKLFSLLFIPVVLAACDASSQSPFSPGGGASSGTNIVSQRNFLIAFDEPNPPVITDEGVDAGVEVAVTINAADRLNLPTTGATAYIDVDWGTLSATSCQIESSGACTVTWRSNASFNDSFFPGRPGGDEQITFTAWIVGEEAFDDINGNGVFDDGDIFLRDVTQTPIYDIQGPFLDLDHSGDYTEGTDKVLIPGNSNGQLTQRNGLFDGQECSHSTLCSGDSSVYISDRAILSIREAP